MSERYITSQSHKVLPIILAGGNGSRLWPASRPDFPKQFVKIDGELSLFQQSLKRCDDVELFRSPIVVVGHNHQHLAQSQMDEIGVTPAVVIAEPVGRDTAAAITLAALAAYDRSDSNQQIAVFPSDHKIGDKVSFLSSVTDAAIIARRSGLMITFGIKPTSPETGYGYIRKGASLVDYDGYTVGRFVEKPCAEKAGLYMRSGNYFWNSGMFVFPLATFFAEMKNHAPRILQTCERAMSSSISDGLVVTPSRVPLQDLDNLSIDYALMERTGFAAVIPFRSSWSDMGTWGAIWQHSEQDEAENASWGDVEMLNSSGSYGYSSGPLTTLVGVKDCVVVSTKDSVLVAHRSAAPQIKDMVKKLKADKRPEVQSHPGEIRPWGNFAPLHNGPTHQVKIIEVNPGGQLSLQKHRHRAEHWIIVAGIATVTVGQEVKNLGPGQHAHIPLGAVHRLENFGNEPVKMIEVQTGDYFGEDDIIRLEDVYNREREPRAPVIA